MAVRNVLYHPLLHTCSIDDIKGTLSTCHHTSCTIVQPSIKLTRKMSYSTNKSYFLAYLAINGGIVNIKRNDLYPCHLRISTYLENGWGPSKYVLF